MELWRHGQGYSLLPTAPLLSKGVIQQLPGQWEPSLHATAVSLQGAPRTEGAAEQLEMDMSSSYIFPLGSRL